MNKEHKIKRKQIATKSFNINYANSLIQSQGLSELRIKKKKKTTKLTIY